VKINDNINKFGHLRYKNYVRATENTPK
jgi:hypothetical protein